MISVTSFDPDVKVMPNFSSLWITETLTTRERILILVLLQNFKLNLLVVENLERVDLSSSLLR